MSSFRLERILQRIPKLQEKYNLFTYYLKDVKEVEGLTHNGITDNKLQGLVCAIKDNMVTSGKTLGPTSCSSQSLREYYSPYDSTVVNLLRSSQATIIGKTNMDEFAMGSTGLNNGIGEGPVRNPLSNNTDDPIVIGGSSSGSAAVVACDLVDFALGTDTGGSVRLPSAWSSINGFKPSYGRISRYGIIDFAQSLDTVGIMSKSTDVIRRVFTVLDKYDHRDPTSLKDELRKEIATNIRESNKNMDGVGRKIKIGLPQEFNIANISSTSKEMILNIIKSLKVKGCEFYPVSIPSIKYSLPIYYTLAPAEASSNLSRYDGIRYGSRDTTKSNENTLYGITRAKFLGKEVQKRIILGNYNLCSDSFKNTFIKAQKLRIRLINEFDSIFLKQNVLTRNKACENGVDFIICPTNMYEPHKIKDVEKTDKTNPVNTYYNDFFTIPMSLAGLPTISTPMSENITFGLQVVGQYGYDEQLLDFVIKNL